MLWKNRHRFVVGFGILLSLNTPGVFPPVHLLLSAATAQIGASNEVPTSGQEAEESKVSRTNWQQHPEIRKVRAIVNLINADLSQRTLKVSERKFEYNEPYEDTLRKMAVDSKGIVRMYEKQGGSDDSALTWKHYYDEAGRLRFVLITGGAVNGAQLEHRIYFDEGGKRLWEVHKYVKGPGYTFPEIWPDDQLQTKDPASAFAAPSNGPELKAKKRKS
jgi:hypothetical protein